MSCSFLYVPEVDVVSEVGTLNNVTIQALTFAIYHTFRSRMLLSAWLLFGLCDAKFVEKEHFFPWWLPDMEP
jgi:hypothetical protein